MNDGNSLTGYFYCFNCGLQVPVGAPHNCIAPIHYGYIEPIKTDNVQYLRVDTDGGLVYEPIPYKKLKFITAIEYFWNCRTCDSGSYGGIKFYDSLKELLDFAKDNWNETELKDIHTNTGKHLGKIEYKTGYHSLEYMEFKIKYLKLRTCDDGHGKLIWKRV